MTEKMYIRVPLQVYGEIVDDWRKMREYVEKLLREKGLEIQHCIEYVGCIDNYSVRKGRRYIIVDYDGYDEQGNKIRMKIYLVPVHTEEVKKLRKQYREEMVEFLKNNGFECKYRGEWVCEHPNYYTVIIDNKGIMLRWDYENNYPGVREEYHDDESYSNSHILKEIVDGADMVDGGGIIYMEYTRLIPWDILYKDKEEFEKELEELKNFISRIKDYKIWFTVDITFHVVKSSDGVQ